MTKKLSIAQVIAAAPSPKELATELLEHLKGNGRKKYSYTLFYNPGDETYDTYGYLMFLIGLDVDTYIAEDGHVMNTGYCIAPDGSRELITLVGNTVLGYDPRRSSVPLPTEFAADWVHLWTGTNSELNSMGLVKPENTSNIVEADIHHREFPMDLVEEIEIISMGSREPLPYEPFRPMIRDKSYAMDDQLS